VNKESIDNDKKYDYLVEIIRQCSGELTDQKSNAKIIVSDRPMNFISLAKKPTVVISTYIFDAAMSGRMIHTGKYAPKA
jgi:hypothetical protein